MADRQNPDIVYGRHQWEDPQDFEEYNTVETPMPGDVQSAIDSVAGEGRGKVELRAKATYDPSSPWTIKEGVTLDYNGSEVVLSSDIDVHHFEYGGRVVDPQVDLTGVTYTSSVFVLEPDSTHWHPGYDIISGGKTTGTLGEGTCLYCHPIGDDAAIGLMDFSHHVEGIGTGIDIHVDAEVGATHSWVNGNTFDVTIYHAETAVHLRKDNGSPSAPSDNEFAGEIQAAADGSDRGWYIEQGAKNVYSGTIWDADRYDTAAVEWASGSEGANVYRTTTDPFVTDHAIHDSGDDTDGFVFEYFGTVNASATSTSYGEGAEADQRGTAIGQLSSCTGDTSVVVGKNSTDAGFGDTTIVGFNSSTVGDQCVVIGDAVEGENQAVLVGSGVTRDGDADRNVAVGYGANVGELSVSVGRTADASGDSSVAVGATSTASGFNATAVGRGATASANHSLAIGRDVTVSTANGGRIGNASDGNAPHQVALAATDTGVFADADLNNEEVVFEPNESGTELLVKYKDSSGTVHSTAVIPSGDW